MTSVALCTCHLFGTAGIAGDFSQNTLAVRIPMA